MPTVSVIIPTYNRAEVLPRAIESVLTQTYEDLELIIVDDGSTDDTKEVIQSYESKKIIYVWQENQGANAARNAGIRTANGEYISFLDSDDKFRPGKIKKSICFLESSPDDCGGVHHSHTVIRNNKIVNIAIAKKEGLGINKLRKSNIIGTFSSFTTRKDILEAIGYLDEQLDASQDYDLYLRIAKKYRIYGITEILTDRFLHGQQITENIDRKMAGFKQIEKKHNLTLSRSRRQHRTRGRMYAEEGEYEAAKKYFLSGARQKSISSLILWLVLSANVSLYKLLINLLSNGKSIYKQILYQIAKIYYE